MRRVKISVLLVMSLGTITAFQNCSSGNVNFASKSPTASIDSAKGSGVADPTQPGTASTPPGTIVQPPVTIVPPPANPPVVGAPPIAPPMEPPVMSPPTVGAPNVCDAPFIAVGGSCVCPGGANYDGKSCVTCAANQTFDASAKSCVSRCASGSNFNGSMCVTCNSAQTWDGKSCVTPSDSCKSFKEVTSPFVIPARDIAQTCYYVKMSKAYANRTSTDWTARDASVESRDHDNHSNMSPIHPYIIGSSATDAGAVGSINFSMQGSRYIMLSGDTFGGQDISADNFILVRAIVNGVKSMLGEGTGDAPTYNTASIAGDTGYINVDHQKLTNYSVGAAGGTASFNPLNLADPVKAFNLPLNTQISLKTEALDCGGVGGASDIYLLFR